MLDLAINIQQNGVFLNKIWVRNKRIAGKKIGEKKAKCDQACEKRTHGHKMHPITLWVITQTLSSGKKYLHSVTCNIAS